MLIPLPQRAAAPALPPCTPISREDLGVVLAGLWRLAACPLDGRDRERRRVRPARRATGSRATAARQSAAGDADVLRDLVRVGVEGGERRRRRRRSGPRSASASVIARPSGDRDQDDPPLDRLSSAKPRPSDSSVPSANVSMTTFAFSTIARKSRPPVSVVMSSVTLRLPSASGGSVRRRCDGDDVRAVVGEEAGAERPGDARREVEDAQVGERGLFGHAFVWLWPPSTTIVAPVTHEARSEQRKATTLAISSAVPKRPIGMFCCDEARHAFRVLLLTPPPRCRPVR